MLHFAPVLKPPSVVGSPALDSGFGAETDHQLRTHVLMSHFIATYTTVIVMIRQPPVLNPTYADVGRNLPKEEELGGCQAAQNHHFAVCVAGRSPFKAQSQVLAFIMSLPKVSQDSRQIARTASRLSLSCASCCAEGVGTCRATTAGRSYSEST
jgi:hypothetical protein